MARTKASAGAKVASGKSSKARSCAAFIPSSYESSGASSSNRSSSGGGNRVCPRETPKWQKPITRFFMGIMKETDDDCGTSNKSRVSKPKRNVIHSDDEDEVEITEKPKNKELDETIELEPLTGEESHKIDEFFPKTRENENQNGENDDSIDKNGESSTENGEKHPSNTIQGVTDDKNTEEDLKNGSQMVKNGETDPKTKGKGVGKMTKQKENVDNNVEVKEQRKSVKRDLEIEESLHSSKKFKAN